MFEFEFLQAFAASGVLLVVILALALVGIKFPVIRRKIRILGLALIVLLARDTIAHFSIKVDSWVDKGLIALLLVILATFLVGLFKGFSESWLALKGLKTSKLISDVVVAIVYIALILVILELFGINVTPLLATSAVLTVVLGFALQDTLANLVAGMVFHFENSIRPGDWLEYDGVIGEVKELSWRAVRLLTTKRDDLLIPNQALTRQKFNNLTRSMAAREKNIGVSYDNDPDLVMKVLKQAILSTRGVRWEPEPQIFIDEFDDFSINYRIRFYPRVYRGYQKLEGEVQRNIWYLFKVHKIRIPFPIRTLHIERRGKDVAETDRSPELLEALHTVEMFKPLSEEEIGELAKHSEIIEYPRGTVVAVEGDPGDSMFAILRGSVDIQKGTQILATLGPKEIFGEISLFTGQPRTATVKSTSRVRTLLIPQRGFEEILKKNHEFIGTIEKMVEQRLSEYPEFKNHPEPEKPKRGILDQLRNYLHGWHS